MTLRPTEHNRQIQGNAIWHWRMGWWMPKTINKGPRGDLVATSTHRVIMSRKDRCIDTSHRHMRHLMAPNCRGGMK